MTPSKDIRKNKDKNILAESRMSFGEHLDELRSRLIKSIYGLLAGFGVCFYFRDDILTFLSQPLLLALEASKIELQLYASSLPEAFMTSVRLSLFGGIFVASPWIIYQLWGFVAAGLFKHERRYVHFFMPFSVILFLLGCVFFIEIVAPISFNFFVKWSTHTKTPSVIKNFMYRALTGEEAEDPNATAGPLGEFDRRFGGVYDGRYVYFAPQNRDGQAAGVVFRYDTKSEFSDSGSWTTFDLDTLGVSDPNRPGNWGKFQPDRLTASTEEQEEKPLIKPWFTLKEYVLLVVLLGLAFGVAFQMPLVVFFVGRLGLVGLSTLKSVRKYVFFGIVVTSALMTPPDVISQVLLSLPMYVLYELGLLLLIIWPRKTA